MIEFRLKAHVDLTLKQRETRDEALSIICRELPTWRYGEIGRIKNFENNYRKRKETSRELVREFNWNHSYKISTKESKEKKSVSHIWSRSNVGRLCG